MSLCISTVVNKEYQKYIPIFIYFIYKSYPEYGIKIFLTDKLKSCYIPIIERLKLLCNVEIKENIFNKRFLNSGQQLKTIRWLINDSFFNDFDNVYIGDIDLIICKESMSLEQFHLNHCILNNLFYSNCIRPNTKRMSGLHFIIKEKYFEKINPIIYKYKNNILNGKIIFNRNIRNEHILYNMIEESGIGFPKNENRVDILGSGPHHGIHLGIWRSKHNLTDGVINHIMMDRYKNHYNYYLSLEKNDLYQEIIKLTKIQEITYMKRFLNKIFN